MDCGVVPFHQPWAGSVVSTVRVPDFTGVILMLFGLLVMSQLPILVAPPLEDAVVDEPDEPHAARATVRTAALPTLRIRLGVRDMRSFLPTGRARVTWLEGGRTSLESQGHWALIRYRSGIASDRIVTGTVTP